MMFCRATVVAGSAAAAAAAAAAAVRASADTGTSQPSRSYEAELAAVRSVSDSTFARWEKDEDGWRKLPPRAW